MCDKKEIQEKELDNEVEKKENKKEGLDIWD